MPSTIPPLTLLACFGLTALTAGGCASIGDGVPGKDTPDFPDADIRPWNPGDPDGDAELDAGPIEPAPLQGKPTILAAVPNLGHENILMYDAETGEPTGEFLSSAVLEDNGGGGQPAHAGQAPDGDIYISDATRNIVQVFSRTGEFVRKMNVESPRALDFYGGNVYIATAKGKVVAFTELGKPIADLVTLTTADYLQDILFLDDGRFLLANGRTDEVLLYDADGSLDRTVVTIDFPQQIQPTDNGTFLVSSYLDNTDDTRGAVIEFDLDGNELRRWDGTTVDHPRGITLLTNGNLLVSVQLPSGCSDDGCLVYSLDADSEITGIVANGPAIRRMEVVLMPDSE